MAESITTRPDIDIEADIQRMMTRYAPLMHDRHRIKITVEKGSVTVVGNVKAAVTFRYLLNNLPNVPGVKSVGAGDFHNDEAIRLDVGQKVPPGIAVRVEYGAVILEGKLPEGASAEDMVREVALVEGVHRVITSFRE